MTGARPVGIRWRGVLAAAMLAACAGCSLIDPNNIIGRDLGEATPPPTQFVPPPESTTLGRGGRERAFDFVWDTIEQRYHDPSFNGVDWNAVGERYRPLALDAPDDDAFWDVLDRMAGELHDSHTRLESPREVELRKHGQTMSLGFSFMPIGGRLAVSSVDPEGDAWWAGVRPGMTVAAIGGKPAAQAYAQLLEHARSASTDRARHFAVLRRLILGAEGSRIPFTFERADGTRLDATLTRSTIERRRREAHRVLPSGFGYIRFSEWSIALTLRALAAIDALKDTPGLVIDLRSNPGGSVHAVNLMLDKLFAKPTQLGSATTRNGRPITLFLGAIDIIALHRQVRGSPDAYRAPVVVLVNALSASGSELFAGSLQAVGRAKVVGQASCGCLLGFLGYARVPGGAALAYSEVGFVLANGRKIEGEGVIPDREVPLTLADLRVSRDRPLEEAQALLASMAAHR
jgi:carboxyl-terminal processing protease